MYLFFYNIIHQYKLSLSTKKVVTQDIHFQLLFEIFPLEE